MERTGQDVARRRAKLRPLAVERVPIGESKLVRGTHARVSCFSYFVVPQLALDHSKRGKATCLFENSHGLKPSQPRSFPTFRLLPWPKLRPERMMWDLAWVDSSCVWRLGATPRQRDRGFELFETCSRQTLFETPPREPSSPTNKKRRRRDSLHKVHRRGLVVEVMCV